MRRKNALTHLPKLPLLITESADEFDALRDAFEREIKPRGIIEADVCARRQLHRLGDPTPAALQGGHHQFSLPQRIANSSQAALKAARPV